MHVTNKPKREKGAYLRFLMVGIAEKGACVRSMINQKRQIRGVLKTYRGGHLSFPTFLMSFAASHSGVRLLLKLGLHPHAQVRYTRKWCHVCALCQRRERDKQVAALLAEES